MLTVERLRNSIRYARALAAEFRDDTALRDALLAYAVELETELVDLLHARGATTDSDPPTGADRMPRRGAASEFWVVECGYLREAALSLEVSDARRRVLRSLADHCERLAELLESRDA
ncbi:MAG: hypothetical protein ACM30I_02610 [Gemmatimonas sp.]